MTPSSLQCAQRHLLFCFYSLTDENDPIFQCLFSASPLMFVSFFLSFWPIFFITYYIVVVDLVFYSTWLEKSQTRLNSWNFQLDPHLVGVDWVFELTRLEKNSTCGIFNSIHTYCKVYTHFSNTHPFGSFYICWCRLYLGYRFSKIQNLTTGNCLRNLSHQKKMKNSKHLHYYWQKKISKAMTEQKQPN